MQINKLKRILLFLKPRQLSALDELLSEEPGPAQIMPHELAHKLGVSAARALVIMSILEGNKIIDIKLLIYHSCTKVVVAATPSSAGFPIVPWKCPHCRKRVNSLDSLRFSHMAIVRSSRRNKLNSAVDQ